MKENLEVIKKTLLLIFDKVEYEMDEAIDIRFHIEHKGVKYLKTFHKVIYKSALEGNNAMQFVQSIVLDFVVEKMPLVKE